MNEIISFIVCSSIIFIGATIIYYCHMVKKIEEPLVYYAVGIAFGVITLIVSIIIRIILLK